MQTNKPNQSFINQIYSNVSASWEQSLVNFIINYSRIKDLKKSNLIIYFNAQTRSMQIVTSAWGMDTSDITKLWNTNTDGNAWIQNALMLGSQVTLETKHNHSAVSTTIDLNNLNLNPIVKTLDVAQFMKTFDTGSRLTINDISFAITKESIANLYKKLQLNLLPILVSQSLKVIINMIDHDGITSYDGNLFIPIKELTKTTYISVPEIEQIDKEINFEIKHNDGLIQINGFVTTNYLTNGIFIYDGYQLITCIDHAWLSLFNKQLSNQFTYVQLDNIQVNFLRTDFIWTPLTKQSFYEMLISAVNQKIKIDDNNELETTKLYLTKAFEISGNSNQFADFEIVKNKLKFVYTADDGKQITINLFKNKKPGANEWLQLIPVQENVIDQIYEYDVNFNLKHPFFATFDQKETQLKIEQFVICYAIAETVCRLDGSSVTKLKYEIDKILRGKL